MNSIKKRNYLIIACVAIVIIIFPRLIFYLFTGTIQE